MPHLTRSRTRTYTHTYYPYTLASHLLCHLGLVLVIETVTETILHADSDRPLYARRPCSLRDENVR